MHLELAPRWACYQNPSWRYAAYQSCESYLFLDIPLGPHLLSQSFSWYQQRTEQHLEHPSPSDRLLLELCSSCSRSVPVRTSSECRYSDSYAILPSRILRTNIMNCQPGTWTCKDPPNPHNGSLGLIRRVRYSPILSTQSYPMSFTTRINFTTSPYFP